MFTINAKEAEKHNGVVAGTLSVSDYIAKVLFYSGATHSFISSRFAKTLDILPEKLSYALEVSIPLGDVVIAGQYFGNVPIKIDGRNFPANLVPLLMMDFDVILGMDWLA